MVLLVYVHPKRRLLCEKTLYVCSFLEIRSWDDTTVWQPYIAKYP